MARARGGCASWEAEAGRSPLGSRGLGILRPLHHPGCHRAAASPAVAASGLITLACAPPAEDSEGQKRKGPRRPAPSCPRALSSMRRDPSDTGADLGEHRRRRSLGAPWPWDLPVPTSRSRAPAPRRACIASPGPAPRLAGPELGLQLLWGLEGARAPPTPLATPSATPPRRRGPTCAVLWVRARVPCVRVCGGVYAAGSRICVCRTVLVGVCMCALCTGAYMHAWVCMRVCIYKCLHMCMCECMCYACVYAWMCMCVCLPSSHGPPGHRPPCMAPSHPWGPYAQPQLGWVEQLSWLCSPRFTGSSAVAVRKAPCGTNRTHQTLPMLPTVWWKSKRNRGLCSAHTGISGRVQWRQNHFLPY